MGVWGGLIIGDDSGGGGVLAATTAVLFILLFFMCEAIAVAGVLGMVGSNLWYVAGCEIGGGRGWVQVVGLKVGRLIQKKEYWFLCSYSVGRVFPILRVGGLSIDVMKVKRIEKIIIIIIIIII